MPITPIDLTQRLAGKVAVITGGASGIGLATAKRFAAEGAKVVIGDVDPTSGQAAAELVDGLFVQVDVTDKEKVDALFDTAASTYGSVVIAFNNAGISPPATTRFRTRSSAPGNAGKWGTLTGGTRAPGPRRGP